VSKLTVPVWGNVASEPMHVVGPNGIPRTTFRLAHTARRRQPDGSYTNGVTSFFNVTCFGYVALNVAASVHRGDPVVLFGEMAVREWSEGSRSGREVDVVAMHIGLNLRWGRARFERPARAGQGDRARTVATDVETGIATGGETGMAAGGATDMAAGGATGMAAGVTSVTGEAAPGARAGGREAASVERAA
jgi:single-strand DNA-binding protein